VWTSRVEDDFVVILEVEAWPDATRVGLGHWLCRSSSCPLTDDATLRVVEGVGDMGTSAMTTQLVGTHFCAPPLYQVEWLNGEELRDRVTRLTCRSFFQNDYGLDRGIN
jgi:hypothetical protein